MTCPTSLPGWPRALKEEWAAAYCGLSRTTFRVEVAPTVKAVRLTPGRVAWLRDDLDEWLDGKRVGGHPQVEEDVHERFRALAEELRAVPRRARRRGGGGLLGHASRGKQRMPDGLAQRR